MNEALSTFLTLDLMPLAAAVFVAIACGLLGNFLVLRRQSLLGDAISHSVLPGIVFAFLFSSSRNPLIILLGAGAAALCSVLLIEVVKRVGRVEPGAAMGVVFSIFFALGILLLQRTARNVDLDAACVLYGQLETLIWMPPAGGATSHATLGSIPRQVFTLAAIALLAIAFVTAFYKELRLMSFDPALGASLGLRVTWLSALLLVLITAATVAAFEAVGSILVIAMLICPAATARLLTDSLRTQLILSTTLGAASAVLGYFAATHWAPALGFPGSLNAAGSITAVTGVLFAAAAVFSPSQGLLAQSYRHRKLTRRVTLEDLLGRLYRSRERGVVEGVSNSDSLAAPGTSDRAFQHTVALACHKGWVRREGTALSLTEQGLTAARELIRRHRLWETYLVEQAGLSPDHVHDPAEQLEHILAADDATWTTPTTDPHGRDIPAAGNNSQ